MKADRPLLVLIVSTALLLPMLGWSLVRLPSAALTAGLLDVRTGMSAADLGTSLRKEHGLDLSPWSFRLLVRAMGAGSRLKAGEYRVRDGESVHGLLSRIVAGDVIHRRVTLIEGATFAQVLRALHRSPRLRRELAGLTESEIRARLGIQAQSLEGLFLPDTYAYVAGMSDLDILRKARTRMQTQLQLLWSKRAPGLPYVVPYEALIAASLVEKETAKPEDRDDIAAVFVRRLRMGMRLQTDPTVIYALGAAFDGNLRRVDLALDNPYNTYVYTGLPPSPIALPSLAALQAALHPAQSDALFFVARGDGSSEFTSSLAAHERAVDRFQRSQ